jgi:pectate lyase
MRFLYLLVVCAGALCAADLPAFPGAEGFGAKSKGGRGGRVLIVNNLNDSGPGSLRAAVDAKGPRIVVFSVSGLIDLKTPIQLREPFITIAGQTAPGDGICLRGYEFSVQSHDVVLRYLRFRPGDIAGKEVDALSIGGESRNVIVDHCSAGWSVDESLSPSGAIADITVQWCLIAEGLNKSVHHKGAHGYGSLVRAVGGLSMHHNLWAHNIARNPRLGDNYGKPPFPTFDIRNNVIYDFGGIASGMTGDTLDANYAANYIRPGPSSNTKHGVIVFTKEAKTRYYAKDNFIEGTQPLFDNMQNVTVMERPFDAPRITATTAKEAYEAVLNTVGASLPRRDAADARIVNEVRTRTGRVIDSQKEVGGWPEYRSAPAPADSDGDGMPDAWEKTHGLNPNDPGDAAKDRDGDGYSNIEEYINSLVRR